jgi:hypothetical protein
MAQSPSKLQALAAKLDPSNTNTDTIFVPSIFPDDIRVPNKQRPGEKGFFDLSGELRNAIYAIWFARKRLVLDLRASQDAEPVLIWLVRWDYSWTNEPLELSILRVSKLINAEVNAILFRDTLVDLRDDKMGTASIGPLHRIVRDPMCARTLQWTRHLRVRLMPILGEESGRKKFAANLDALLEVFKGEPQLKSLEIHFHCNLYARDYPTKEQVKQSIMSLERFRVVSCLKIKQQIHGDEEYERCEYERWISGSWGYELLDTLNGKQALLALLLDTLMYLTNY